MFGPERYDLTGYYSFSSTQTPGCDRDPFVTMERWATPTEGGQA